MTPQQLVFQVQTLWMERRRERKKNFNLGQELKELQTENLQLKHAVDLSLADRKQL